MRKIIFSAATTIVLLISSATAFAGGPNYPQGGGTSSGTPPSGQQPSATSTTPTTQAYQARVTIQNMSFTPANLTVWQGTSVIWTNQDNTAHTVTSDASGSSPGFDSGPIDPGKHYGYLFGKIGTFAYHCTIHPNMTGTITVVAQPQSTAPVNPSPSSRPTPPAQPAPSASAQSNATATVNNYNTYNQETEKQPAAATTTVTAPPAVVYTAPANTYTKEAPATTVLPDTGPAGAIAIAMTASILGAGAYYLYILRRKSSYPQ